MNMIRLFSTGPDVVKLQNCLKHLGYDLGSFGVDKNGIDGVFGNITEMAVKRFQNEAGLEVDGIVGPATWSALSRRCRWWMMWLRNIKKL